MAITPQQFIAPQGELEREWYPLGDLDDRLQWWVSNAMLAVADVDAADQDIAAEAHVYIAAYRKAEQIQAAKPKRLTIDSGKTEAERDTELIRQFQIARGRWQSVLGDYVATQSRTIRA